QGQIFRRRREILVVVILQAQPLQNFRGDPAIGTRGHERVYFTRQGRPVFDIKKAGDDADGRQIVILLLVQLPRGIERSERALVIFRFEGGFADVVIGLRSDRAFRKLFQQLPERVRHSFRIVLLADDQCLLLKGGFALVCGRIFRQQQVQIFESPVVILVRLVSKGTLRQSRRHLRTIREQELRRGSRRFE